MKVPIPRAGAKAALLRQSPLFRTCSQRLLAMVARRCATLHPPDATVLLIEGQPTTRLWIVKTGEVRLSRAGTSVATVSRGGTIGLAATVAGTSPSTATTVGRAELLVLELAQLWQLALGSNLARSMVIGLGGYLAAACPEVLLS